MSFLVGAFLLLWSAAEAPASQQMSGRPVRTQAANNKETHPSTHSMCFLLLAQGCVCVCFLLLLQRGGVVCYCCLCARVLSKKAHPRTNSQQKAALEAAPRAKQQHPPPSHQQQQQKDPSAATVKNTNSKKIHTKHSYWIYLWGSIAGP